MDVLRFINSKDIREHLEYINYEFNSPEAAWLIWQCRTASLTEKHAAWRELIETTPDQAIPERQNTVPQPSLHGFLMRYMELEEAYIRRFFERTDEHVYSYSLRYTDGSSQKTKLVYPDLEACFTAAMEYEEDEDVAALSILKQHIQTHHYAIRVTMSPDRQIYDVQCSTLLRAENEIRHGVFDGMWFDFPTPFQKGDVLCEYDPFGRETSGFCKGPFVMTAVTPENAKESTRLYGDTSDMNAWGYFQREDGTVYGEVMSNYMDLEYYRGELTGKRRILRALSSYIKNEIDLGLFADAYHHILIDEYAKAVFPTNYTAAGLKLAGLEKV